MKKLNEISMSKTIPPKEKESMMKELLSNKISNRFLI